jgi:CheY-like chemotaxis protein
MNIPRGPILVVEDVAQIRELLAATLRFEGYPVITAQNGKEALEIIAEQPPALVITDILMPKMDGYSLVYRLRRNEETRSIPIVFLSATYVTREDKEFALSLGAVRFLEKPVDTPEFLLTIGEILAEGPTVTTQPLSRDVFYGGYRERLEHKLRQKSQQIARTERLLKTLPPEQRPAFEGLLRDSKMHRDEIAQELDEIIQLIKKNEAQKNE